MATSGPNSLSAYHPMEIMVAGSFYSHPTVHRLRYLLYVVLSDHLQLSSLLTNHQVFTPSQIQSQKAQIEKMCEYDFQKDTDTLLVSGSKWGRQHLDAFKSPIINNLQWKCMYPAECRLDSNQAWLDSLNALVGDSLYALGEATT